MTTKSQFEQIWPCLLYTSCIEFRSINYKRENVTKEKHLPLPKNELNVVELPLIKILCEEGVREYSDNDDYDGDYDDDKDMYSQPDYDELYQTLLYSQLWWNSIYLYLNILYLTL